MGENQKRSLIRKRNKVKIKSYSILFSIATILLISIVLGIKVLSVSVASVDQIKEMIVGEGVLINNKYVKLTNENISSIEIINRITKKNKEDNVDIKIKVVADLKSFYIYSNVKLEYMDNKWILKENNFSNITDIEVNPNDEDVITNEIRKLGFKTINGNKYSSSSINKIENLKFSQNNLNDNYLFTAEVIISNGVCYQRGNISGQIIYDEKGEELTINNVNLEGDHKIYKEDNINEDIIKNIIIEEITDGYSYEFNDDGEKKYYKIEKEDINEFSIKQYVIKDDYTIRAEVEGKAKGNNMVEILFSGFVSISGNPLEGNIGNSRDIIIDCIKKRMQ